MLLQAQRTLSALDDRARALEEAKRAAEALRVLAARAAKARVDAVERDVRPVQAAQGMHAHYVAAARTCPGLPWTVLSAIGQVETGHGQNTATSTAGARGPMQFMPATFAAYGVDGDGDGDTDILDAADSVFSAGNYLCASGAGDGPGSLRKAVYGYNHAWWYVDMVLRIASETADQAGQPD